MRKQEFQIKIKTVKAWTVRLVTIFLSFVLLLCSPILATLLLPIYIFRYLTSKLAPLVRPDLGKILCSRSAVFAADDLYNRPLNTLICKYVVEGTLGIARVKKLFLRNILSAKSMDGTPEYEELTQYISSWMGFAFWRNETDFRLDEHVRSIEVKGAVTEPQLTKYFNELSLKPFEKKKSPWEMIIVPNLVRVANDDGKPKSAAIIRVHHSIGDGFSLLLLGLLLSAPANDSDGIAKYRQTKRLGPDRKPFLRRFSEGVYFSLRAPYELIRYNWELADPIRPNSWHVPENELQRKWTMATLYEDIACDFVKEIKNCYGVSFNAIIMAAAAGSIRNFMLRNPSKEIPDFIRSGTPLPIPHHPGKLRNFFTACALKLPVGESCPVKRIMYVEKELQGLKKSPSPMTMFLVVPFIGSLFTPLIRLVTKVKNVSAFVSSMPGPLDPLYFLERRLLYIEFYFGLGPGNTGIGMSIMSNNGVIRIGASVDNGLISSCEDVQALANGVKDELLWFKKFAKDFQVQSLQNRKA